MGVIDIRNKSCKENSTFLMFISFYVSVLLFSIPSQHELKIVRLRLGLGFRQGDKIHSLRITPNTSLCRSSTHTENVEQRTNFVHFENAFKGLFRLITLMRGLLKLAKLRIYANSGYKTVEQQ